MTWALLLTATLANGDTSESAPKTISFRALADAGDTATLAAAQATLDRLARQFVEEGGGFIVVDQRVAKAFKRTTAVNQAVISPE